MTPRLSRPAYVIGGLAIAWLGIVMLKNYPPGEWPWLFLSNVDLVFHEAGHPLFGILGEVAAAAGGCVMQLLIPVVCLVAFYRERQEPGIVFALFWIGE